MKREMFIIGAMLLGLSACAQTGGGASGNAAASSAAATQAAAKEVTSFSAKRTSNSDALTQVDPPPELLLEQAPPLPEENSIQEIAIIEPVAPTYDFDDDVVIVPELLTGDGHDLLSFVADGGVYTSSVGGVDRYTRTARNASGDWVTVTVDYLPGDLIGLVSSRVHGEMAAYSVGEALTPVSLPEGLYNGVFDVTYRDGNSAVQVASGDMSAYIDLTSGQVLFGGMAIGSTGSLEVYGEADLVDGAFASTDQLVVLRDANGSYIRDEAADVSGITTDDHVIGMIEGYNAETDFEVQGGFVATN